MSIRKYVKKALEQIGDESKQIKSDSARDREAMLAHSTEFQEQFYVTKTEIEEKRKSIQKIMR